MAQSEKIIQDYASRKDSIRYILSNETWSRGISTFFLENIPFSFSTSTEFADMLLKIIQEFCSQTLLTHCNIHEFGAGIGLLTKNIAHVAQHSYPKIYPTLNLDISDGSKEAIDTIHSLNLLSPYEKKIKTSVLDCCSDFPKEIPNVAILSYLIDSLPTRHIEVKQGRIYERVVSASLKKNAVVIDFSQSPPSILKGDDIISLIHAPLNERKKALLGQLVACIKERFTLVPISETMTDADEKKALESLIASLPNSKKLRFNFSYQAHQLLSQLFSKMPNKGIVCIFDMGVVSPTTIPKQKSMYGIYGACIFFSVYFPHICYIAKQHGWDASITNVKEGHSQMALFYRGVPSKTFSNFCNTQLCKEQGDDAFSAQKTLLEISKKRSAKAFSIKTKKTLDSLNRRQKESYALLTCMAQEYQKRGMLEDAAKTCHTIISLYGRTGVTAQLILANILNDMNHTEDAFEILTQAIKTAPYFFRLHNLMALIEGKRGNHAAFIESAKKALIYSPRITSMIWRHLITMTLMYIEQKDTQKARDLHAFTTHMDTHYPSVVPKKITKKMTEIIHTFLPALS